MPSLVELGEGGWRVGAGIKLHAGGGIRATERQLRGLCEDNSLNYLLIYDC